MSSPVVNKGHVYFDSEDCIPRENSVIVKQNSPSLVQIHVGFLQYHHIYNVSVEIPKGVFLGYDVLALLDAIGENASNVNCKVISIEDKRDVFEFLIEFCADRENLLKEEMKICLAGDSEIKLEFSARVLGPGKGTPLLKNGVKCIGVVRDEMSGGTD